MIFQFQHSREMEREDFFQIHCQIKTRNISMFNL